MLRKRGRSWCRSRFGRGRRWRGSLLDLVVEIVRLLDSVVDRRQVAEVLTSIGEELAAVRFELVNEVRFGDAGDV